MGPENIHAYLFPDKIFGRLDWRPLKGISADVRMLITAV